MRLGALSNADAKYFHGKLPTWNNFVAHPDYDKFWQDQALVNQLKKVTVPSCTSRVGGTRRISGPVKAIFWKTDSNHVNYLVVGPAEPRRLESADGRQIGKHRFWQSCQPVFSSEHLSTVVRILLEGQRGLRQPEATTFETGSNRWTSFDSHAAPPMWFPAIFFPGIGKLSFEWPTAKRTFRS